jgi:hypothetical protein
MGEGPADKKALEKEAMELSLATTITPVEQMDMFDKLDVFWNPGPDQSRTFDLFDALPKFHFSKQREITNIDELAIYRSTKYKNREYITALTPAIITNFKTKKTKAIFPGEREELIERALRKMAVQKMMESQEYLATSQRDFLKLTCTLYQLRKELADSGHDLPFDKIKEGLEVLSGAMLIIETDADERIHGMKSAILPNLSYSYDKKDESGRTCYISVTFHALAVEAIKKLAHYPINYSRVMTLPSPLARWLYTRVSHNYRQASRNLLSDKGWTISLETILNESGIVREPRLRDSISTVRSALEELKLSGALSKLKPYEERPHYDEERKIRGQKPITNVHWTLHPSSQLVTEIIDGNDKMAKARTALASKTIENPSHEKIQQ